MKRYTLIIDTSASSPESKLYIYEARTIKEAKAKLAELNLIFTSGYIYCATIGRKEIGRKNNRYLEVARTDNGINWSKTKRADSGHTFIPENWLRIHEWKLIGYFQN